MLQGRLVAVVAIAAGLTASCAVPSHRAAGPIGLTPAEMRGKMIYTNGRDASGRPVSFWLLGAGDGLLPAKGVVCATCHGPNGKGAREGDIIIADIQYATLTKSLPASPPWYKERAPYTDATLARAITAGIDSSGNPLESSMPRWSLAESDLRDLLQYLKRLGAD